MEEEEAVFNQEIPMKVDLPSKKEQKAQIANFELRKKVCQKFACLLQKVYSIEKAKSQELTLSIEDKVNELYLNSTNEYKQAIKNLLKIIKVKFYFA